MKGKRLFTLLAVCVFALGCLSAPAGAVTIPDSNTQSFITRATGQFESTISANSILTVGESFILGIGDTVAYNCTYTPRDASIKFGFIAPDSLFYGLSGSNGSINKTIRVSQRGTYTLAIKNNSDTTVTVSGTVNY